VIVYIPTGQDQMVQFPTVIENQVQVEAKNQPVDVLPRSVSPENTFENEFSGSCRLREKMKAPSPHGRAVALQIH